MVALLAAEELDLASELTDAELAVEGVEALETAELTLSELAAETEVASLLVWSVFKSEDEPGVASLAAEDAALVASELVEATALLAALLIGETLAALEDAG